MTKKELLSKIEDLEPNNPILTDARVTNEALTAELKAARRRTATAKSAKATPANMKFRLEENERYSWKLFVDEVQMAELNHGMDLPELGSIHPDYNGRPLKVATRREGMPIIAGDLSIRDEFDERRVYETASGTAVTFKRIQDDLVVLWSYRHSDEIAIGQGTELFRLNRKAQPVAQNKQRKTQKVVAAWFISQMPNITGTELTRQLREVFPAHRISDRHGPHYLSLSRKGRLPEPPEEDPRDW